MLALSGTPALAEPLNLTLPAGAVQAAQTSSPAASYALAVGPWKSDAVDAVDLEGARSDTAWRLRANQNTTLQLLATLREQLVDAGYTLLYECDTDACGGFDFRYALDLLPEPAMHVDLGDFRYLAARKGDEYVAVTVSRSSESGFVEITNLSVRDVKPLLPDNPLAIPQQSAPLPGSAASPSSSAFATQLESQGSVALDDLDFASGEVTLGAQEFASLKALAAYLAANPDARVVLVGHTDAGGSLAANIALSKKRAAAARAKIIADFGTDPAQISAEGAGYLAPRATNLTKAGREKNRRVEAVLTSTQS
jgi:OOP family OmpA-OmpF porin